jgi:hypothetical protein
MSLLALSLAALLGQAEPAAEVPEAPPAATTPVAPASDQTPPANAPLRSTRVPSPEELTRQLERIRRLPPGEMAGAMDEFRRKFPTADAIKAKAQEDDVHVSDEGKVHELTEAEQVKYYARAAFNAIIAGDARGLVLQSGYPFQLEDRRLEMPDELHKEWLKNLRSKRTDLLTLYDIEVLTPAEMEKKYGRPPARLKAMPWSSGKTLIAVGNLSGHAAIAVFRSGGPGTWQMVGYHD